MKARHIAKRQQEKAFYRLHRRVGPVRVSGGLSMRRFWQGHRFYNGFVIGDHEIAIRFVSDVGTAGGGGSI